MLPAPIGIFLALNPDKFFGAGVLTLLFLSSDIRLFCYSLRFQFIVLEYRPNVCLYTNTGLPKQASVGTIIYKRSVVGRPKYSNGFLDDFWCQLKF